MIRREGHRDFRNNEFSKPGTPNLPSPDEKCWLVFFDDFQPRIVHRLAARLGHVRLVLERAGPHSSFADLDLAAELQEIIVALGGEVGQSGRKLLEGGGSFIKGILAAGRDLVAMGVETGEQPTITRRHLTAIGLDLGFAGLQNGFNDVVLSPGARHAHKNIPTIATNTVFFISSSYGSSVSNKIWNFQSAFPAGDTSTDY